MFVAFLIVLSAVVWTAVPALYFKKDLQEWFLNRFGSDD